jgi:hypothetical protein
MKIRSGLVSNSSSSSFIIATKDELNEAQLKEVIMKAMKVPADSPLYEFVKDIANCLANTRDEYDVRELLEDYSSVAVFSRYWPVIGRAVRKGFSHFYRGSASSESGDPATLALVDMGFDYEDDNIAIEKEAGY